MIRIVHLSLILLPLLVGCASRNAAREPVDRVTILVPGAGGDGRWYDGLYQELHAESRALHVHRWGSAWFFRNFSDRQIHDDAERKLAAYLDALPPRVGRIDLVAHSAGCGIVLGGVARSRRNVDRLILLAPSVSPGYDLRPAIARVNGPVHIFHSERDTTFLRWRTSHFGTYDRVKTPAAGYAGFDLATLDMSSAASITQHPWCPAWRAYQNTGGHFGATARPFVRAVVLPLLSESERGVLSASALSR